MFKHRIQLLSILLIAGTLAGCSNPSSNTKNTAVNNKTVKVVKEKSTKNKSQSEQKNREKKPAVDNSPLAKLKERKSKNLVYVSFGDSISVGLFADNNNQKFTELVRQEVAQKTSKSVNGNQIAEVGKTATNFGIPNLNNVISQNPDLVTIEFGTNDAVGGINNTFFDQFSSSMEQIITSLKQNTKAQLVLVTTWSPANGQYAKSDLVYDKEIIALGKKYQIPVANLEDIWINDSSVVGPVGATIPDFSNWGVRDDFHPNQKGHQSIANKIMSVLEKQGE